MTEQSKQQEPYTRSPAMLRAVVIAARLARLTDHPRNAPSCPQPVAPIDEYRSDRRFEVWRYEAASRWAVALDMHALEPQNFRESRMSGYSTGGVFTSAPKTMTNNWYTRLTTTTSRAKPVTVPPSPLMMRKSTAGMPR
jgi:hypothetical protein